MRLPRLSAPTRDRSGAAGPAAAGPAHVVCVGNELAGDDGVEIRVGRILRQLALPASARVFLYPALGFDWIDTLGAVRRVVNRGGRRTLDGKGSRDTDRGGSVLGTTQSRRGTDDNLPAGSCCPRGRAANCSIESEAWPPVRFAGSGTSGK